MSREPERDVNLRRPLVKADRTLFYGRADTPCVYMEGYGWLGLRAAEALADELRAAAVEARTLDLGRTKKGVEP